jgi:hypothetical protein
VAGPRLIVNAPTFTPSPYGLLSVAQQVNTDGTPHWQNGITWQSRCLVPMGRLTYDECIAVTGAGGPPPEPSAKSDVLDLTLRGATPFTAYAKFDCALVGMDEALKIANDALAQSEPWQVERAFWTGFADGRRVVFPHLTNNAEVLDPQGIELQSPASVVVTGGAVDAVTALGLLESALADCYNGVGVIHVPVKLLPTLQTHGLASVQNGKLKTLNGNLVAVGGGYPGTSPAGAVPAAGESWMYATGAVFMYRGSVQVPADRVSSVNRATNTREMIAERTYVLGWDCCHHAVLVDIGVPIT